MIEKLIQEIADFESEKPETFPEFAKSQKKVIDLVDNYWISKYRDGDRDSLGLKKCFYNVVQNPTEVAAKMIDLDTKDVRLTSENGQSYYPTWFLKKELDVWMKENRLSKLFNKVVFDLPKYGSVVLKKVGDKVYNVPLQNLIIDQTAESIDKARYVIEKHEMTKPELRKKNWNNIDEAIETFSNGGKVKVYERYSPVEESYQVICGIEDQPNALVLYETEMKESPYKDVHWEKVPGRWLGRGQVERLFEAQIHQNQIANYKRQGLYWTSKHIYQTRDDQVSRNLMTEVDNGDVLRTNDEVTPIVNEERNLSAYREEEQRWDMLSDKLTFSYDVMRGERSPAGTPLGSSILQSKMAGGFFDLKREDLGIFFKDLIFEWVLPSFQKSHSAEHTMKFFGTEEELERYDKLLTNYWTNIERKNFVERNDYVPNKFQSITMKMKIRNAIKKRKEKYLKIPDNFYKDLKFKIDVVITGEQVDVASKLQTMQTIFQIIGSNPTILKDKLTKRFFFKMIDLAGISPAEFQELEDTQSPEEVAVEGQAQRGGSLSRVPNISPTESMQTQTNL